MNLTFSVDSVSKKKRKVPVNQYTDAEEGDAGWRVSLKCDRIPNRYLDLWYDEEADARKFPSRKSLSLAEVFGSMGSLDVKLKVRDISKDRKLLGMNRYTDKPDWMEAWAARLVQDEAMQKTGLQQADLWYDNEREARMFSFNFVYQPFDLFRLFKILVTFYPAHEYVTEFMPEGFFDNQGYHQPGVYPHGFYPAGYFTGKAIDLEVATEGFLGVQGWIIAKV